jgi:PEP-CTERM motif-containing protein
MKRIVVALMAIGILGGIPAVANIVVNPGFESGLTGWTASQDWGSGNFAVHTGTLEAFTQCVGAACISTPTSFLYQDLTTVATQTYTLTFWYRFQGPSGTVNINELRTLAGGVIVSDLVDQGNNGGVYQQAVATFVATGPTTRIQFDGRNDPSFLIIDDVCVDSNSGSCPAVPEPASMTLLSAGLLGLACLRLRRKRA